MTERISSLKKEAKNFCQDGFGFSGQAWSVYQKFSGSFFQKRTTLFLGEGE
jgi:hypothetical protein